MSQLGMRPRFVLQLNEVDANASYSHVQQHVLSQASDCVAMFRQPHMEILFKPKHRKYWSPRLSLEFEAEEEGTAIRGLIAPQPGIWTMFMAGYFSMIFLAFVGVTLGYSQWSLNQAAWGFYVMWAALGGTLILYIMSLLGQRLALEQTIYLRSFLQESLRMYQEQLSVREG